MKSYDDITATLLERRDSYVAAQPRKRKQVTGVAVSIGCLCVAALGFIVWRGGMFNLAPSRSAKDSGTQAAGSANDQNDGVFCGDYWVVDKGGEKTPESRTSTAEISDADTADAPIDVLGMVVVNGVTYLQFQTETDTYTPAVCLGFAADFEGTYQTLLHDVTAKLYTTKENPDVLVVTWEEKAATVTLMKQNN